MYLLCCNILVFQIYQITPAWKESAPGDFDSVVKLLEELCSTNDLHSYGFSMNIEPFNMHTPAPNRCVVCEVYVQIYYVHCTHSFLCVQRS